MNKDQIEQLADDYAAAYIQAHTNIPMDSYKYRALVRAFVNFYKATQQTIHLVVGDQRFAVCGVTLQTNSATSDCSQVTCADCLPVAQVRQSLKHKTAPDSPPSKRRRGS